jgi:hypothetical protein
MRRRVLMKGPQLRPELIDILLTGDTRTGAEMVDGKPYDPFVIFDDHDYRALWQAHRGNLLAEWRRRGCSGCPWAQEQFEQAHTELEQRQ